MNKAIGLFVIVFIFLAGRKGWQYFKKYQHSNRLKVGIDSFKLPKLNLSNLFSDIKADVLIKLNNFSSSSFEIEQLNVEIYSLSGKLIGEQEKPLAKTAIVQPNKNNLLPLSFLISSQDLQQLIKEAGGVANVGANFLTTGDYGIPLHLKGFVVAEGFTIDIDEKITV